MLPMDFIKFRINRSGEQRLRIGKAIAAVCLFLALSLFSSTTSYGQGSSGYPRLDYWAAMTEFYEGEFRSAATGFNRTSRIKSPEGEWIDSICHRAMLGECFYQMGQSRLALQQYDMALSLFANNPQWMLRLYMPNVLPQSFRSTRKVTWGPSSRQMVMGKTPESLTIFRGRLDNFLVLQQGGTVQPAMLTPINAREIVRCLTLAIRRRTELLGVTCRLSPLTNRVVENLEQRPAVANHWTQGWVSLMLGVAKHSVGESQAAVAELQSSISFGRMDHELSGLALLELGKLAFEQKQYQQAANYFKEATISSALYNGYGVVEEAVRWGVKNQSAGDLPGTFPGLAEIANFARLESEWLEASTYTSAAESAVAAEQHQQAEALVKKAQTVINRAEMGAGEMGARLLFVNALSAFQRRELAAGQQAMSKLLTFQTDASPWLLQIAHADALFKNGSITERTADLVYERVLRDPGPIDWIYSPRDTLKYLLSDHEPVMERWFELAMNRKEVERAVEITDRIRRHRFYKTLPMGGRVLSLRWILEGPEELLSKTALQQRQALLNKYPNYQHNRQVLEQLLAKVEDLPLAPQQADDVGVQQQTFPILAQGTVAQETYLQRMALEPNPTEFCFPPLYNMKELKAQLPPNQVVISFFATKRTLYGFMLSNEKYQSWKIGSPATILASLRTMYRHMGHFEANTEVTPTMLAKEDWKQSLVAIQNAIFGNVQENPFDAGRQVVIVPDGFLWYVPFELLPLGENPLIATHMVRYSPTVSLVLGDGRNQRPITRTSVVDGPFALEDDEKLRAELLKGFTDQINTAEVLPLEFPGTGAQLGPVSNQLIVFQDMAGTHAATYEWSVTPGRVGSSLNDWMKIPWSNCDIVCLPGYRTGVESGLKQHAGGNEIFLATVGMLASGSRTVALSRWRVGGESTYKLMGEFLEKSRDLPVDQAWQVAINTIRAGQSAADKEPRARDFDAPIDTSHPFFWSGYMLIDISSAANGAVPIDQLKIEKEAEANANLNQNPNAVANPNGGQVGNKIILGNPKPGGLNLNPNGDGKKEDDPVEFKPPNFLKGNK